MEPVIEWVTGETVVVIAKTSCEMVSDDHVLTDMISPHDLNKALSSNWPHAEVGAVSVARIGEDFGFGGNVYRLDVETAGGAQTLIAKHETREQVEREVKAYEHMGDALRGRVPELYGWGDEITLFELIAPATQGDGLKIQDWQVEPLLRLLADLHGATWSSDTEPWVPEHWDDDRWQARVDLAGERYPEHMSDQLRDRLLLLHAEVPEALAAMKKGPTALTHMDSGHDNTLWRPDGSVVLLDWSNARFGSPTLDLSAHIVDGDADDIIEVYVRRLQANRVAISTKEVVADLQHTVKIFARGMVGFAGVPGEPTQRRLRQFRYGALELADAALDWIDRSQH